MPPGASKSKLIQVFKTSFKELSGEFIAYDTKVKGSNSYYKLPKSELLVLLLLSSKGYLWTTIRRYTPTKEIYYKSLVGQTFDCIIVAG